MIYILEIWVFSIIRGLNMGKPGQDACCCTKEGWPVFASVFGIYSRLCTKIHFTIFDIQLVLGWFGICLTDKWCVYGGCQSLVGLAGHGMGGMVLVVWYGMVWVAWYWPGGHMPSILCLCHSYQLHALALTYGLLWEYHHIMMMLGPGNVTAILPLLFPEYSFHLTPWWKNGWI